MVPEHTVSEVASIKMEGTIKGTTDITTVSEIAGFPEAQVAFDVKEQET
jgi:hypothetical protein